MTPDEIRQHQFSKSFRGFAPSEVTSFLESTAVALEHLQRQHDEATKKIAELETRAKDYHAVESVLQQTLIQAQETSTRAMEYARKEAQLLIHEAEAKALHVVERATNDLTNLQEQITIVQAKKDALIARLKILLHSELDLLKVFEGNPGSRPVPKSEEGSTSIDANAEIDEIMKSLDGL